ncbi:major capsid protein [Corynebacterium glutamicum]|uniref:major capsid protein n=1 Tax=Corynebacterium glutamicum TaxID=1718 RepID=UPI000941E142|nr:major capsid protein [Corynebacterium glutamicum]OKX79828.1 hypothetical protein AUO95_11545 [Corynebacterium glutamicum]
MSFYPGNADLKEGVISIDEALNNPTIIEQRVAELAENNLIVDNVFAEGGDVSGGAVIYSKVTEKHLFAENDVADRQPGDEYPSLYIARPEAQLAKVQDFGGKFATSHEARKRNLTVDFDNDVTILANTISRKLNQRAVETLDAAIDSGDVPTFGAGSDWESIILDGAPDSITAPQLRPTADLATIIAHADNLDMGIEYKNLLVHPNTRANLRIAYGTNLTAMLEDFGLTLISSSHMPKDKAYLVDPSKLGFIRYEEGLTVHTWEDGAHRQTWTQGYAMPVMGVTTPAALGVILGIAA